MRIPRPKAQIVVVRREIAATAGYMRVALNQLRIAARSSGSI